MRSAKEGWRGWWGSKTTSLGISRRGWQANGCLNELARFRVESIFTTAPERVDSVSCG
jgi:hypothetical protein